jgi:hypothetical protein
VAVAGSVSSVTFEADPGPAAHREPPLRQVSAPVLPWSHRTWLRTLAPLLLAILLLVTLAAAANTAAQRWGSNSVSRVSSPVVVQAGP